MSFKYDKNNKYHRLGRSALIVVVSLTFFVLAWWVVSILAHSTVIPTPIKTFDALISFLQDGYLGISAGRVTSSAN